MCIKYQELHSKPNATQNFQKSTKIMKCYNVEKCSGHVNKGLGASHCILCAQQDLNLAAFCTRRGHNKFRKVKPIVRFTLGSLWVKIRALEGVSKRRHSVFYP